jgi:hypothetical protein
MQGKPVGVLIPTGPRPGNNMAGNKLITLLPGRVGLVVIICNFSASNSLAFLSPILEGCGLAKG